MQAREKLLRKVLFDKATSKQHLKDWIHNFLDIDMPDGLVCGDNIDGHEPSNSNPMDLLWEVYSKALKGDDGSFQKVLVYAARDSFKTLAASILELLCLFHLGRNVAHMAAIEAQAAKCQEYLSKYIERPILRDYVTSKNKRTIEITRYIHQVTGKIISPREWEAKPIQERDEYVPHSNYMKILVATMAGSNSEHVPFMVLDELDLAPEKPIEEAKMIPSMGPRGELPITFMISSRKSNHGPVQKELDKATDPKNNIQVRHWNILDVSRPCPASKHLPGEPKIPIYINEDTFAALSKEEYGILSQEEQLRYREVEGYTGCLKNCAIFAACKGRLATKQQSTSRILKPLPMVTETFRSVTPETAQAQLMCWKPSSVGSIYPYFSRERHMLSANKMVELIEGTAPHHLVSKAELIEILKKRNWNFHLGMDFGFTHNFAAVLGATDGYRVLIIDVLSVAGLELNEKVEACKSKYLYLNPMVYPDPAYPSDIKTFRKNGFRCKSFEKDVLLGIDAVRSKLSPGLNKPPELFLLAGDSGCDLLAKRLTEYHWAMDAAGEVTDQPDKKNDDECDALRYMFQNLFGKGGKLVVAAQETGKRSTSNPYSRENWMKSKITELTSETGTGPIRGKKGSFIFDL